MSDTDRTDVAVIGAGAVGLSCAIRLAAEDREVMLIDRGDSENASTGNCSTIATYAVIPLGTPSLLRKAPGLLLATDSPLTLRYGAMTAIGPWLMRLAWNARPSKMRQNAAALSWLMADAFDAWRDLAREIGADRMIRRNGCLYLYDDDRCFANASWERQMRSALGVRQEAVAPKELTQLEPAIGHLGAYGLFFPDSGSIADPGEMMAALATAARAKGVRFVQADIRSIRPDASGAQIVGARANGGAFDARAGSVVISAGLWSRDLARGLGERIPMVSETGYHVEYPDADFGERSIQLNRPVCRLSGGFYFTPLTGRLRAAGTIDLGGSAGAPNRTRWDYLDRRARRVFPDLPEPTHHWSGHRPSTPDSLPVIGESHASDKVIYAFGHGHLGLTLAPITARLVADLAAGRKAPPQLDRFSPARFKRNPTRHMSRPNN